MALATQQHRRRILLGFADCKAPCGKRYGDNKLATIGRLNVQAALKGRPATTQKDWLKALRSFFKFARDDGLIKFDPTAGLQAPKAAESDGFLDFEDAAIAHYRAHYAVGTMARLALELALNMAARRHDLHVIGHPHLSFNTERQWWELSWTPHKTRRKKGGKLTVRVLPPLQACLDAMPRTDAMPFLLNDRGQPFKSPSALGIKFADWVSATGLKPVLCDDGKVRSYRLHGLRKAACRIMAEHDCTAPQIMSVSGHKSLAEAQKYIDAVNKKRAAATAMEMVAAGSKR